jgi:uncharacterized LabA/DUF88 family protein
MILSITKDGERMRTAIFIDGLTLFYMLDGKRINFVNFKKWLLGEDTGVYNAYFNNMKEVDSKNKFFSHIEKSGFTLYINKIEFDSRFNNNEQKNIDMNITIEALKRVNDFDKIIIVSGKSNLLQLCESLTLQGKQILIVATQKNISKSYNKYEKKYLAEYFETPEVLIHET